MLPMQVIFSGKTADSLPKVRGVTYKETRWDYGGTAKEKIASNYKHIAVGASKPLTDHKTTLCFKIEAASEKFKRGVGSVCLTHNHWADATTSKEYVDLIAVPYFEAQKKRLGKPANQVCVLIMDCWWGWLDQGFRRHVKENYTWLRMLFVPGACTPKGQPMDAGVVAMVKGVLRQKYGDWVAQLVMDHLGLGKEPGDFKLSQGWPEAKIQLLEWLVEAVDSVQEAKAAKLVHVWEKTELTLAWDEGKQQKARECVAELFSQEKEDDMPAIEIDDDGQGGEEHPGGENEVGYLDDAVLDKEQREVPIENVQEEEEYSEQVANSLEQRAGRPVEQLQAPQYVGLQGFNMESYFPQTAMRLWD
mmetsp:Transcript_8263/g.16475  ORF Transcript_8263/g.16475 Transcript_8263/m.16475 type:complete len:361 (-) Transcript_8263:30-1112(-)